MPARLDHFRNDLAVYRALGEKIKALEERRQTIRAAIELELGNNTVGTVEGREVVRTTSFKRTTFDSKTFRREHPDQAALYEKVTETTRFTVLGDDE